MRRIIWNVRCSDFAFSDYPPMTGRIVGLLARLSHMPSVVAVNSLASQRAHIRLGYHPKRWAYLPNGFNTSEWKPIGRSKMRAELGLGENEFAIGRVGRVDQQKDFATFITALQMIASRQPSLRPVLIGRGTDELKLPAELKATTQALGLRRDMPEIIRALDLVVSSSAYDGGLPNVVAEAMASGVPCVVTDVGDCATLVGNSGIVVRPRDPAAMARAVETMMAMPREELAQMAARGRRRVTKFFDPDLPRPISGAHHCSGNRISKRWRLSPRMRQEPENPRQRTVQRKKVAHRRLIDSSSGSWAQPT